jgi:type II secretion system protein G
MKQSGFTLIELVIVIAIIGLLASAVLTQLSDARGLAQDARRKQDLSTLKIALEAFRNDNGRYPNTNQQWWGVSNNGGNRATSGTSGYIPGLAPAYIEVLPTDPLGDLSGWSGYQYVSDASGSSYKLIIHANGPTAIPPPGDPFHDPLRPTWAWMICSGPPACGY